jgi:hypothetical protein
MKISGSTAGELQENQGDDRLRCWLRRFFVFPGGICVYSFRRVPGATFIRANTAGI